MIELVEYAHLSEADHRRILELRNQPHVREVSGTKHEISWEEHSAWLQKRDRGNWAVIRDGIWGALHLTKQGRWGLFFDSEVHPFLPALTSVALLDRAFEEHESVEALVQRGYDRQLRFDERLGMRCVGFEGDFHLLRMSKKEWKGPPAIRRLSQRTPVLWRD